MQSKCVRRVPRGRRGANASCVWSGNSDGEAVIVIQPLTGSSLRSSFEDKGGDRGVVRTNSLPRARYVFGNGEHPAPRSGGGNLPPPGRSPSAAGKATRGVSGGLTTAVARRLALEESWEFIMAADIVR